MEAQSTATDQSPPKSPGSAAQAVAGDSAEIASRDTPATFKTRVNLVLVPVVVRDRQGLAVGDLKQEDFRLFDKGKPQVITRFTIQQPGTRIAIEAEAQEGVSEEAPAGERKPASLPEHYVAYLFDDIHLNFADLVRSRDAVDRHLSTSLQPNDRAAIYTTSGQTVLDFTDDLGKLHESLLRLRQRPIAPPAGIECPDVSLFVADLIQNKNDLRALQSATLDALGCLSLDRSQMKFAEQTARAAAARALSTGDTETRLSLAVLKEVVGRLSAIPGERSLIFVSPGFMTSERQQEITEIVDRAIRKNVVISSLDARGLYAPAPLGDISQPVYDSVAAGLKDEYARAAAFLQADVLAEVAEGTGGAFWHNNNDLTGGIKRLSTAPEYVYVLGFSPQNLKLDGQFHNLKVNLKDSKNLTLQARRGYYAPRRVADPAEAAKEEIREALFSRDEMHDLPVQLQTQFFKSGSDNARVAVLVHVDLKQIQFRKADGRNYNELTVIAGLFDRNGRFISGIQKTVDMRIRDETLERRLASGITLKSTFDVTPGSYMIRLVVRDTERQLMAAQNGAVEIP